MVEKNGDVKSATENFQRELQRRIRAGYPAIFVRTFEEERTLKTIKASCDKIKRSMWSWDCILDPAISADATPSTSIKLYLGTPNPKKEDTKRYEIADVSGLLPTFLKVRSDPTLPKDEEEKAVLAVMDFNYFVGDNVILVRSIKNSLSRMKRDGKVVIFIGPRLVIPEELKKDITTLDFPLPDRSELMLILEYVLKCAENAAKGKTDISAEIKEKLCEAALGLTSTEAEDLFSLTIAKNYKLDDSSIKTVIEGKQALIKEDGLLEFFTPDISLEDVGGLKRLKAWFKGRLHAFTQDAHDFGLPYPKGVLMVGIPGCGKSLVAKAIAAFWGVPLVRLDMGRIYNKFQGASEDNARRAIMLAEAVAPSILWIDEVEKGFSGVKSSDETSGGVQARVVQTFLTWMQEKTSAVFLACTGNAVDKLPPELLRKGRFDEIFFVNLPNEEERKEITKIQIRKRPRKVDKDGKVTTVPRKLSDSEVAKIAAKSEGYTGAEIEQAVLDALNECYNHGKRDLKAEDIIKYFEGPEAYIPLSKTMEVEIKSLTQWGEGKAKNASEDVPEEPESTTASFLRIVKHAEEDEK